ncbi:hypothetical protein B0J15DRAFT_495853 [Fusarium solani]|uniref:Secreted protein n=1 Tax=Fusarium solani TaxID=169388 RepID=A0A9P9H4W3_FUSSL|nr:uncharacterized protein B0J15DRAFT_495853 [Fusarium solani]KAH7250400.1 hypothetical protein B0J15DRAFT_495853 [Fusarium solani]
MTFDGMSSCGVACLSLLFFPHTHWPVLGSSSLSHKVEAKEQTTAADKIRSFDSPCVFWLKQVVRATLKSGAYRSRSLKWPVFKTWLPINDTG